MGKFGNSPNAWKSGEFPNSLENLSVVYFLNIGKFLKCLAIWEISQIPRHLGNFPKIQNFEKLQNLKIHHPQISIGIWEIRGIPQLPENLGNSPNSYESGWDIPQLPGNLRVVYFSIIGNFSNA